MNEEIFADGINSIHITGDLVRIDLVTLQPQLQTDNGQPVYHSAKRIVMPLAGFVQAFGLQQDIIRQLIEAGAVKQDEENPPAAQQ